MKRLWFIPLLLTLYACHRIPAEDIQTVIRIVRETCDVVETVNDCTIPQDDGAGGAGGSK
jgi:hypothetical protein